MFEKRKFHALVASLIFSGALLASVKVPSSSAQSAAARTSAALTGVVTSEAEGRMEGVLVTAEPEGGTVRTTVVSDDQGHYAFPSDRLQPGKYNIAIRAVGYDLSAPIVAVIAKGKPSRADIKLVKTTDLASQLSGTEWMMSVPGTEQEKKGLRRCQGCHELSVVTHSTHTAEEFLTTWLPKMQNYYIGQSTFAHPFPPPKTRIIRTDLPIDPDLAKFVSSVNLSGGRTTWPYELRTLPRPRGGDTKVIITEYKLSRSGVAPHDMGIDLQGRVWYSDFRNGFVGRLDPVTGKEKEWKLPVLRPGQPELTLSLDVDKEGNPWWVRFYQGCSMTTMDGKTEQFKTFTAPDEINPIISQCSQGTIGPDGMIWEFGGGVSGGKSFMFDPEKGFVKAYDQFPPGTKKTIGAPYQDYYGVSIKFNEVIRGTDRHEIYGASVLKDGNPIYCDTLASTIAVLDRSTGTVTLYPTPTYDAFPRRGTVDPQGKFWFGEWLGDQIGMFDPDTKEIREWKPPTPFNGFYRATGDKNGEAWAGSVLSDYVSRLNPKTGRWRQYLMPTHFPDDRDIKIDYTGGHEKVWVTYLQAGYLTKIEPLD
jgi:virginiamycin B lyase